ncbi:unnamed protein product [Bathycoccus prasinos]
MTALAACAICAFCDQNPAAAFDAIDAANMDVFAVGFPSDTSLLGHHEEREAFSQIAMAGEDIPFWANMAKYARFSISIMVGFVYMFARPVAKLMKDPKTAALVVLVAIAGVQFFKFTLTEMLAMNDPESFLYFPFTSRIRHNNTQQRTIMGAIKTIAVLIAMEAEAEPLISSFKLLPCPKSHHHAPLPSVVRSGEISFGEENKAVEIVLVTCGQDATHAVDSVGTVNAALCAYEVLKTHRPDVLINAGTAGGFQSKGCEIGDVFLVSEVKFHDRRIPIPTFTSYGIGAIETLKTPNMRKEITSLKSGICSTGNSLDATDVDREMMLQNDASVKEMEAAAVAKVCEMFKTPFVCVKAITDIVDGPHATETEFLENLAMAGRRLQETVPKVLEFMSGKSVADL